MTATVLQFAPRPLTFTEDDRAVFTEASALLTRLRRRPVVVDVFLDPGSAEMGEYASFFRGIPGEDDSELLLTIVQTRVPGRRFARTEADGHEVAAGNDLREVLGLLPA